MLMSKQARRTSRASVKQAVQQPQRWGEQPFSPDQVARMRHTRRHPRPTQFDYLHVRYLLDDLAAALRRVGGSAETVLDVFCGTRPYDDLMPRSALVTGFDIPGNPYGVADVVSAEFLPFADESFDLVLCIEGLHYAPDPRTAAAELRRILRPGGHVVVSVPLVWEYDRTVLEHRFTGPSLAQLFDGWDEVTVVENGGRAVSWATLTGQMLNMAECHVSQQLGLRSAAAPAFKALYTLVNGVAFVADRLERRLARSSMTLPMNLLLIARRARDGAGGA
jgi:SAM-dependent methyltransferase